MATSGLFSNGILYRTFRAYSWGVEDLISAVRQHPEYFPNVRHWVDADDFFMMQEFNNVKAYYEKLQRRIQHEVESDDLFD